MSVFIFISLAGASRIISRTFCAFRFCFAFEIGGIKRSGDRELELQAEIIAEIFKLAQAEEAQKKIFANSSSIELHSLTAKCMQIIHFYVRVCDASIWHQNFPPVRSLISLKWISIEAIVQKKNLLEFSS